MERWRERERAIEGEEREERREREKRERERARLVFRRITTSRIKLTTIHSCT